MNTSTIIEMANLDSIVIVAEEYHEALRSAPYLKVFLKGREKPVYITEEDKNYEAYLGIFKLKEAQIQQYLENIQNKDND
jgi:hypothetical protein